MTPAQIIDVGELISTVATSVQLDQPLPDPLALLAARDGLLVSWRLDGDGQALVMSAAVDLIAAWLEMPASSRDQSGNLLRAMALVAAVREALEA